MTETESNFIDDSATNRKLILQQLNWQLQFQDKQLQKEFYEFNRHKKLDIIIFGSALYFPCIILPISIAAACFAGSWEGSLFAWLNAMGAAIASTMSWLLVYEKHFSTTTWNAWFVWVRLLYMISVSFTLLIGSQRAFFTTCDDFPEQLQRYLIDWDCSYDHGHLPDHVMAILVVLPFVMLLALKEIHIFHVMLIMIGFNSTFIAITASHGQSMSFIVPIICFTILDAVMAIELHFNRIHSYLSYRQLQETLKENKRMQEENRATELRNMIGNLAHDLKTPLSSFMTGIDIMAHNLQSIETILLEDHVNLLNTTDYHEKHDIHGHNSCYSMVKTSINALHKCFHNIKDTNSFMLMTINRCIDYTKASKGLKLTPKYETVDLMETISMPLQCMKNIQEKIEIELTAIAEDICSHIITDKQWLQENLLCLLSNAVKYSAGGNVTISVSLVFYPPTCPEQHQVTSDNNNKQQRDKKITTVLQSPAGRSVRGSARIHHKHAPFDVEEKESSTTSSNMLLSYNNASNKFDRSSLRLFFAPRKSIGNLLDSIRNNNNYNNNNSLHSNCTREKGSPNLLDATITNTIRKKLDTKASPQSSYYSSSGKSITYTTTKPDAAIIITSNEPRPIASHPTLLPQMQRIHPDLTDSPPTCHKRKGYEEHQQQGDSNRLVLQDMETSSLDHSYSNGFGTPHHHSTATLKHVPLPTSTSSLLSNPHVTGKHTMSNTSIQSHITSPPHSPAKLTTISSTHFVDSPSINGANSGWYLQFEVADHGIGLSEEAMKNLFNPFQQAQRLAGGTGLGLYSLAKRMEAIHGRYGVQARKDAEKGSLFWFAIPYKADDFMAKVAVEQHQQQTRSSLSVSPITVPAKDFDTNPISSKVQPININNIVSTSKAASPKASARYLPTSTAHIIASPKSSRSTSLSINHLVRTILLVDDSPTITKMVSMMLKQHGYTVTVAENGALALQAIESQDTNGYYDIVLMDLQMPVMDGLEATRRIRTAERALLQNHKQCGRHQVIIGMSANSDHETMTEALAAGFDDFITKPFYIDTFLEIVKRNMLQSLSIDS